MSEVKNKFKSLLPEGAFEAVIDIIQSEAITIKLFHGGRRYLGMYSHELNGRGTISLDISQNSYSLFISLLHELAHRIVRSKFGTKAKPHGVEWKNEFGRLLNEMSQLPSLPVDVKKLMQEMAVSPKSVQYYNYNAGKVLLTYDTNTQYKTLLSDLQRGDEFMVDNSQIFIKGDLVRTRYRCQLKSTNRWYLFQESTPVKKV